MNRLQQAGSLGQFLRF